MRLAAASLSKHKNGADAALACDLHDFRGRVFVDSLVAGCVPEHVVKLKGVVALAEHHQATTPKA